MKNLIFLLLTFLLFACAKPKTNQQKVEDLVKLYLDSTLNDPKSYQSVKFRKVDTSFNSIYSDPKYLQLDNRYDSLMKLDQNLMKNLYSNYALHHLNDIKKKSDQLLNDAKIALDKKSDFMKKYKPKQNGWEVLHSYRGKNSFGALILTTTRFYLDKGLTKVDSTEEMKN